jgi:pantoate--beta-alanine ligase
MKVIRSIRAMRQFVDEARSNGKSVGLVPTMGFFHEGHLSLMRKARKECGSVVVSIFVNPAQFAPGEDLEKYPRDFARDRKLAESVGVDAIFFPSAEQMYSENYSTYVVEEALSKSLCGGIRPGHFRGVATVVLKLFNITGPDRAYFGQKDAQQALIVKRMVRDLNLPVKVRVLPIVREKDGLAMSSRNKYLGPDERKDALVLRHALVMAKNMVDLGEKSCYKIKCKMVKLIEEAGSSRVDYISIVDAQTLLEVKKVEGRLIIALAVFFGKARLIDNIVVKSREK